MIALASDTQGKKNCFFYLAIKHNRLLFKNKGFIRSLSVHQTVFETF